MMPALALFRGSVRLLLLTQRTIALLALQVAPALLYLFAASGRTDAATEEAFTNVTTVALFGLVVPICAIVLGSSALGAERRDETLSLITLRPIGRSMIAVAKFAAVWLSAFVLAVVGVGALHLALTATLGFDASLLLAMLGGSAAATLAYAAIYVPLGFLTDRAVIIGLALLLVFENGVVSALPGLSALSPSRLGLRVMGLMDPEVQIPLSNVVGDLSFESGAIALSLIIYTVIGVVITTTLIKNRDMT